MKFLADINIPQTVINSLGKNGHDILDFKTINLVAPDTELIKIAQQEKRIILTKDKDFISLTQFPKYQIPTIVIRLKDQKPLHILDRLLQLLENPKKEILKKSLTIIEEDIANSYPY